MKLPNKFYIVMNTLIYLLLILSFIYLFIALIVKYNLFFNIKLDFKFIIPLMGSIATVILAILTFQMVREMKKAREEDSRPYVYADFIFDSSVIFIMVRNSGRTGAKNIKFTFDPSLISSDNKNISDINMFKNGIKFLPPDKELKTWFDMGPEFYKSKLPRAYTICIQYENIITNKRYFEKYELDLETNEGIIYIRKNTIHEAVKELENINKTLKGLSSGQGFLVETREARKKRHKEYAENIKKLREEQKKSKEGNKKQ